MTEFFGAPNAHFWHWTNGLHFALVGLAGGVAFVAGLLHLRDRKARGLTLLALALIALDLFLLWAESSARFRFTHVWLFLSFRPAAPIWWGSWGLLASLAFGAWLYLRPGFRPAAYGLLLGSLVVLAYPGLALAVNQEARPLWNAFLAAYFPLSALLLGLWTAYLLGNKEYEGLALGGVWASFLLTLLYPLSLSGVARGLFAHLEPGFWLLSGLLLLALLLPPRARVALGGVLVLALRAFLVLGGQSGFGL